MKNILVVDGAINCAYDIFEVTDNDFHLFFGDQDQDIEFIEDMASRKDWPDLSRRQKKCIKIR